MNPTGTKLHPKEFLRAALKRIIGEFGLKIGRALLHPKQLLEEAIKIGPQTIRALFLFKKPFPLIQHYRYRTSPSEKRIQLRDGKQLILSNHRLDPLVLFQVFCERVYTTDWNDVIVDVGANIGLFSLYAAFNSAQKVHAFEPNREAYNVMLENIRRNNLQTIIIPHNYAVTSRSSEVVSIPKAASPQNRISYKNVGRDQDEYELVNTISLDDIVSRENMSRVDLLKMDCEGSEYEILEGMSESTFSKINRIIVEYHDGKVGELTEKLKQHGFKLEKQSQESVTMGMLWFRR